MAVRTKMRKEVTFTTIKCARVVLKDGEPQAETLEDVKVLGNRSMEQAQRIINKEYGAGTQVIEVVPDTRHYEMDVLEFVEHATEIKPDEETQQENVE